MSTSEPARPADPRGGSAEIQPLEQPFDVTGLVSLRSGVAAHSSALGLPPGRCDDLVLIANELASNVAAHGGGRGRLRLWSADGRVYCEVTDAGPGLPAGLTVPAQRPPLGATGGRGLWLVQTLADDMDIRSGPDGTTVTATICLTAH
jgi:anti-sigma regulatory factor (Ser/Thr protein kinase)